MHIPFNFNHWLDKNRHTLVPPVGNKNLTPDSEDYIVMVVAGPNARKDYHYNETEEFFYQLEGRITVRTQMDGQIVDHVLEAGDMFICPAKTPHSPIREEGSMGLVVERKRAGKGFTDGLLWFCDTCNGPLHAAYFELHNIEKDFLPHFHAFYGDASLRTCKNCGTTMDTDPRFVK
ncbi:MAG TPA: 3-hydroxyanthranilate 3,4-dioxygenase [Cryomorphaceae bacterium]|jgi:3-hydroxyanthranilate 3,4-dioxygenase|nr:MAG: 3-hydroxyanthranilate 3,4-dioxygenase [Cryomorphaceae bacterium BACL7 MAG-120910-bin2]KRO69157.1 MAG: 3-hydroxyanthranilate 3,4-dioxygenase [Cryomorphaceae bacterium BACL7 MAG-120322-bin74]KRO83898.1 MAG: 3-hydroxyanthranilate 3,4-dioxygenase [Cryomorphaceae bacterium BACL7 MAG-121220-bin83]NQW24943.1 3-hydroxyanthranilate 3,4-dioxygenase [Cryomorphaceae bacterium]HAB32165.1 3-hydroxyanthranilate 3,4-dioxygenase [Cryomorphaceae bacterium]|tara:strand:- start:579 stop:1106 length:528 start_codon:yes stop_codon:yes gene_type:complete